MARQAGEPGMTADEFRNLLATRSDIELLGLCLHDEDTPYLFETNVASWNGFRTSMVDSLGILASVVSQKFATLDSQ